MRKPCTFARTLAGAAGLLIAGTARADFLIDGFSSSFFAAFESAMAPFHDVQDVTLDGSGAVRSSSAQSFLGDSGTILMRVTNANGYEFIASNTPGGAGLTVAWFGGLVPGVPAEGPGAITTDDVEPLAPVLDLSAENRFEIDVTLVTGAASLEVFVYGPAVTNTIIDQSGAITLAPGAQTVVVEFADLFADVDPGAIGSLGFVIGTAAAANVNIVRFEAISTCAGDLDGNGAVGFADLNMMLTDWGPCPAPCPSDLDGSGAVGFADLNELLTAWGGCS